jgi:hypothetical protein
VTPLHQYLKRNGIPSALVESLLRDRLGDRAPHRKTFARWRLDRGDIRRKDMVRVLWAVRVASGNLQVRLDEIFDLDTENPDNWRE